MPALAGIVVTGSPKEVKKVTKDTGASPSGKAAGFDPAIRRFESCRPCQFSNTGFSSRYWKIKRVQDENVFDQIVRNDLARQPRRGESHGWDEHKNVGNVFEPRRGPKGEPHGWGEQSCRPCQFSGFTACSAHGA